MRVWIFCSIVALIVACQPRGMAGQQTSEHGQAAPATQPSAANSSTQPEAPMSDEDKANELSEQVGKLMVKCVNLLTAQDPTSLDYCKQQRDLADQYPPRQRVVDKMLAHDEYGIALAAFDRQRDALVEFNEEIVLLPQAVKPGTAEWSTAYWHRAMAHSQLGEYSLADRDYRAAEESLRKHEREQGDLHPDTKMKMVLRQHAMVLEREGKPDAAQKLLAEAAK
jgi:tetratricopeptide (TPR) repeat protein